MVEFQERRQGERKREKFCKKERGREEEGGLFLKRNLGDRKSIKVGQLSSKMVRKNLVAKNLKNKIVKK